MDFDMTAFSAAFCTATFFALQNVGSVRPEKHYIQEKLDIRYADANTRQVLDIFRPQEVKGRPVVIFVHGGAWITGDKCLLGLNRGFGRFLAQQGIVAVLINYQLSPAVKHPEHVKDVARAFAWTRRNIKNFGGDPDQIFLCGHSAGGHLVSLLATNESYLKDESLNLKDEDREAIRGVISVCGVYLIPTGSEFTTLVFEMLNGLLRKGDRPLVRQAFGRIAERMKECNPFPLIFGDDPEECALASPVKHVRKGLPPFLLVNAERDFPTLPQMTKEFAKALKKEETDVKTITLKNRSHALILFRAHTVEDPLAKEILEFIDKHRRT
jgi:acetyl esterase/lipase